MAAAHYSDFRSQSAHLIHLARERRVYVSYRVADRIYWTRKTVTLHAGEALLSDGTHLARTRCGNRISESPVGPTSPADPPAEVLNTPVWPHLQDLSPESVTEAPIWTDSPTPFLLAFGSGPRPATPGGDGPFVPFFPLVPCCGGTLGPTPGVTAPPNPLPQPFPIAPQPPVATPEPQTLVLLAVGLASYVLLLKFRRS